MKKMIWVVILIIFIILSLFIAALNIEYLPGSKYCKIDDDCTFMETDRCSCMMGGSFVVINKAYAPLAKITKLINLFLSRDKVCFAWIRCPKSIVCINNTCNARYS